MSKVVVSQITHEVFGNCLKLDNSFVELVVSLDFGPRILHCSLVGYENMFYNDLTKGPLGDKFDVFEGDVLSLYGGHRIWISPEVVPRCYHPDNEPVTYKVIENGVIVSAAIEKVNQIQKIMTITLAPDATAVNVKNTIKNCGVWDIELAPWCITMMDVGGKEIVPMPERNTGLLANRNITLWPYSDMSDERVHWGKKFITLKQNPEAEDAFKFGINNEEGWGAYFNKGQVFFKFFDPERDGNYPDNGCCYETYTNAAMIEIETLGEFVLLAPGEETFIVEDWEIFRADFVPSDNEAEIEAEIKKYLNM